MNKRNWIISISSEHDDPRVFGPYTHPRAKELVEKINARIEQRTEEDALGNFLYATAYPIQNLGIRAILAEYDL